MCHFDRCSRPNCQDLQLVIFSKLTYKEKYTPNLAVIFTDLRTDGVVTPDRRQSKTLLTIDVRGLRSLKSVLIAMYCLVCHVSVSRATNGNRKLCF